MRELADKPDESCVAGEFEQSEMERSVCCQKPVEITRDRGAFYLSKRRFELVELSPPDSRA